MNCFLLFSAASIFLFKEEEEEEKEPNRILRIALSVNFIHLIAQAINMPDSRKYYVYFVWSEIGHAVGCFVWFEFDSLLPLQKASSSV